MSLSLPKRMPESGFYHHYKHDPKRAVNDYAYEVLGVGFHTENDTRPGEEHFVVYRPLYEAAVYAAAQKFGVPCYDVRPLEMWMDEDVDYKDGRRGPRFLKIEDPQVIAELTRVRDLMYPPQY